MHFHPPLIEARLLKRYKRFLADVVFFNTDCDHISTVYCPNTGSMTNCQPQNAKVWCSYSANPKRKYPYTLELVAVPDNETHKQHLVGINTHRANALVEEAIINGVIKEFQGYSTIRREVKYGNSSRIDLLLQNEKYPDCYVEVKSVTLYQGSGAGFFPDAVTQRGTRHLKELTCVAQSGSRAVLCFCVQHTGINVVKPAVDIDPAYVKALLEAYKNGVEIIAYAASITPELIILERVVPVNFVQVP